MAAARTPSPKVYVSVRVDFTEEGLMLPRSLLWADGRRYAIDRVMDVRPACAARAGGHGDRYTVLVSGHEKQLFFEHSTDEGDRNVGKWFIERKEA